MKLFLVKSRNDLGDIVYTTVVAANNRNESLNLVSNAHSYNMDDLESEIIPDAVVGPNIFKPTILI
jgi:hypothetical protein